MDIHKDIIIIGGGGLFIPDTNKNSNSGWQWAISDEMLEQISTQISLFAIGYNFFPNQKPDDLFIRGLNKIVDKSKFVGLRNYGSINSVKNLLMHKKLEDKIHFQPCTTTILRLIDKKIPKKRKSKNVAVNLAFDRTNLRFGENMYNSINSIALAVKELEEKGLGQMTPGESSILDYRHQFSCNLYFL